MGQFRNTIGLIWYLSGYVLVVASGNQAIDYASSALKGARSGTVRMPRPVYVDVAGRERHKENLVKGVLIGNEYQCKRKQAMLV